MLNPFSTNPHQLIQKNEVLDLLMILIGNATRVNSMSFTTEAEYTFESGKPANDLITIRIELITPHNDPVRKFIQKTDPPILMEPPHL